MYQQILVPTDGSACSAYAIKHALELAKSCGATVTFLFSYESASITWLDAYGSSYWEDVREAWEREATELLARAERMAQQVGVKATTVLLKDVHPVEAIVTAGPKFDLIIMGSHGRRGFDRWLKGSVTEGVFRRTYQPHLTIPCPAENELEERVRS